MADQPLVGKTTNVSLPKATASTGLPHLDLTSDQINALKARIRDLKTPASDRISQTPLQTRENAVATYRPVERMDIKLPGQQDAVRAMAFKPPVEQSGPTLAVIKYIFGAIKGGE
jgi:hypothetical protein